MPYLLGRGVTKVTCFYIFTVTSLFAPPRGGEILVVLRKMFSAVIHFHYSLRREIPS